MKPIEIKPQVYWIGALHPDLRVFDIIMSTKNTARPTTAI